MFDIGFSELVLVSIVALLVLGPDKLPGAVRTCSLWIGRLKRSFNNIKADIEREVGADEIRRQLRNEAIMEKIKQTRSQVTQSIESVKQQAEAVKKDLDVTDLASGQPSTPPPPPPPPPLSPGAASGPATGTTGSADSAPASRPAAAPDSPSGDPAPAAPSSAAPAAPASTPLDDDNK